MRLMIVDDSKIIRNRIQRAVDDFGLEVVGTAANGLEAVELAEKVKPDIATIDLTMPEMNGVECIEKLLEKMPNVLVLVVSALADKATAIEAMKKGAQGFLCKPFTEKQLTDAISQLVQENA